jgi:hypothetical protein
MSTRIAPLADFDPIGEENIEVVQYLLNLVIRSTDRQRHATLKRVVLEELRCIDQGWDERRQWYVVFCDNCNVKQPWLDQAPPFEQKVANLRCNKCVQAILNQRLPGLDWTIQSLHTWFNDAEQSYEWRRTLTLNLWLEQIESDHNVVGLLLSEHGTKALNNLLSQDVSFWTKDNLDLLQVLPGEIKRVEISEISSTIPWPRR